MHKHSPPTYRGDHFIASSPYTMTCHGQPMKKCFILRRQVRRQFRRDERLYWLQLKSERRNSIRGAATAGTSFYAPMRPQHGPSGRLFRCPRCAKIFPSYSEAATLVSIPLAKVDATAEKQLRKRYDITKYPTINFYENGDGPHEYDGGTETKGNIIIEPPFMPVQVEKSTFRYC